MYVYDYVSTFWKGNASSILNPNSAKSQESLSQESPLLELFKKRIPQNSLETVPPRSLQWMKLVLLKAATDSQNSYLTAIDTALLKTQKSAKEILTPSTIFPLAIIE